MTTATNGQPCRISVDGPEKRVDLAVPATTTVAALLPVLLHHTAGRAGADLTSPEQSWVLQRLGGEPFDPAGTPESLDWLEGERLYLRPVENQLPELHFDDISEGIAETVNHRRDRWQPEYRRPLFIGVSAAVAALLSAVLMRSPVPGLRIGAGTALAVALLITAVVFARRLNDGGLSTMLGLGACAQAGVAAYGLVDPDSALGVGAGAAIGVALLLVLAQTLWAESLSYPVFLTVAGLGVVVDGVLSLRSSGGMDAPAAAGLAAGILFGLVLVSPNIVLRAGGLRGPQLPKTGGELSFDIDPYAADEMDARARRSENYLTVLVVCTAAALPALFAVILPAGGWASWALVGVLSAAVLLRARVMLNAVQRVAFTLCGSIGVVMLTLRLAGRVSTGWFVLVLLVLAVLLVVTVQAAIRPWPRRLLPIWEFTATVFDVIAGVAILPIILQLLHLYAWARGLFG